LVRPLDPGPRAQARARGWRSLGRQGVDVVVGVYLVAAGFTR
jgi:hypothetical protein